MKCRKCGKPVHECSDCKGQTRTSAWGSVLTCRTCNSTGYLCGSHGGHWK